VTRRRIVVFSLVAAGVATFLGGSFLVLRYAKHRGLEGASNQIEAPPRFEWRSVDKKHWQAVAALEEEPSVTDGREGNRGSCGPGMVHARGKHLLDSFGHDTSGEIEELQNKSCTNWISKDFPARCQTFDRTQWLELSAKLPRRELSFCIDRFEYPNVKGANPVIVVTYTEAQNLCKQSGKRLCTETEWTYACEGDEGSPYPYGYDRDPDACVVDRSWKPFAQNAMSPRDGAQAKAELDRLWQGQPSGSRPGCKSPVGVYDMTGNVDEWTKSVRSSGYASVLKGGYWGPVRARCRPSTRAHNEQFVAYQQGFRCCADVGAQVAAPKTTGPTSSAVASAAAPPGSASALASASASGPRPVASASASGAPVASVSQPAVGLPTTAAIPLADESDDDEHLNLKHLEDLKPKVGLSCATSGAGERGPSWALSALLVGVGVGVARRARRRGAPRRRAPN